MVFQAYSLFPNMTAAQNVEFGLKVGARAARIAARRVSELLEIVGLGHAADRYPHELSGGMQQRVALARALAIEPRVLLLDEPLSALDALVRVQLREEIRRVQTQLGITTLYVTHDQEEALSVSDRVAVMRAARSSRSGRRREIYGAPATPLRGRVHRHDEPARLDDRVVRRGRYRRHPRPGRRGRRPPRRRQASCCSCARSRSS